MSQEISKSESTARPISEKDIISHFSDYPKGRITVLDKVDSTNTYLKNAFLDGSAGFFDAVIAKKQSAGRGRLGRSFSSAENKGIYLSYLMNPNGATPEEISEITAWTAVAVRRAIFSACETETDIKWVNDLVLNGKKLCGILTELSVKGSTLDNAAVIVGIGINVNHEEEDFPSELSEIASSLKILKGKSFSLSKISANVLKELYRMTDDFPKKKNEYLSEYRQSLAVIGRKCRIIKNDTERFGTVTGLCSDFGLEIAFDDGETKIVRDGEVSVRGFYGYA